MLQADSPHSPTVLVIDDEPIILRAVRAALAANHHLLEADTATKGLEVSDKFHGAIDLVVADHALKGATGQQVISKIRAARPNVRVLYFSSYSRNHPSNADLPADAEILEKPFLPRDLRGAVFRLLRDQRGGEAADSPEFCAAIEVRNPDCVETLRDEVFRSRSLFGRLLAASKLWNCTKNSYEHRWSSRYGARDVDDAVGLLHDQTLVAWLSFSLRQQKADVRIFLESASSNPAGELWRLQALGRSALPQTAIEPERQLFLSELTVIQTLLQLEF